MSNAFQRIADAVSKVVHRVDAPLAAGLVVFSKLMRYSTGSRITINGDAMSILARRQAFTPLQNRRYAFFQIARGFLPRCDRVNGLFLPGAVSVPRYSRSAPASRSST